MRPASISAWGVRGIVEGYGTGQSISGHRKITSIPPWPLRPRRVESVCDLWEMPGCSCAAKSHFAMENKSSTVPKNITAAQFHPCCFDVGSVITDGGVGEACGRGKFYRGVHRLRIGPPWESNPTPFQHPTRPPVTVERDESRIDVQVENGFLAFGPRVVRARG